jgi:hypothetical protein
VIILKVRKHDAQCEDYVYDRVRPRGLGNRIMHKSRGGVIQSSKIWVRVELVGRITKPSINSSSE